MNELSRGNVSLSVVKTKLLKQHVITQWMCSVLGNMEEPVIIVFFSLTISPQYLGIYLNMKN